LKSKLTFIFLIFLEPEANVNLHLTNRVKFLTANQKLVLCLLSEDLLLAIKKSKEKIIGTYQSERKVIG